MNQALPLKTRNRRAAGNRAPAIRNWEAQNPESNDAAKLLQVQRLRAFLNCSDAMAATLSRLVYGEARS
jgi:hypothetical protein